ncbi:hypothetical protein ACFQVA_41160 [Actinomadura keratinilytica]
MTSTVLSAVNGEGRRVGGGGAEQAGRQDLAAPQGELRLVQGVEGGQGLGVHPGVRTARGFGVDQEERPGCSAWAVRSRPQRAAPARSRRLRRTARPRRA